MSKKNQIESIVLGQLVCYNCKAVGKVTGDVSSLGWHKCSDCELFTAKPLPELLEWARDNETELNTLYGERNAHDYEVEVSFDLDDVPPNGWENEWDDWNESGRE